MHSTLSKSTVRSIKTGSVIKGRDIVIIGLQPWYYEIGSNCKNIAQGFSENNRVLYVNLPINRKTYHSKPTNAGVQRHLDVINKKQDGLVKVKENMWEFYPSCIVESINWLPFTSLFKMVNHFNNRRLAKEIDKALLQLGFKDYILFNDNDIYNGYGLKENLKPAVSIYYCRDFLQGYPYWRKHCSVLEPELIAKSDLVVTNSSYYADYCSQFNGNAHYIGQGCNVELFNTSTVYNTPADTRKISSPIIGYVGALDSIRLNVEILRLIASARPDWSIVLVGPEDEVFKSSDLHQMPNVHFLGRKELKELPSYIQSFDVCINPQLINNVTMGNYPLKVDEYLAMGKPVVASRTKAMNLFENHTYLADQPEEYVGLIEKALNEDDEEKRKERAFFGQSHTWENSMKELYKRIIQTEHSKYN